MAHGTGPGLRERKRAKTRALIQAEALRLFTKNGYDATSVEEIAAVAEVSPRTVFRYFPTKADLVRYDALDESLLQAIRAQPPSMSAVESIRRAFTATFRTLSVHDRTTQSMRERLFREVPELRAVMFEELAHAVATTISVVAARTERTAENLEVVALSGAVLGIIVAISLTTDDHLGDEFAARADRALGLLETGFRL